MAAILNSLWAKTDRLYAIWNGVSNLDRLVSFVAWQWWLYHNLLEGAIWWLVTSQYSKHLPTSRTFLLTPAEILVNAARTERVSTAKFLWPSKVIHADDTVVVFSQTIRRSGRSGGSRSDRSWLCGGSGGGHVTATSSHVWLDTVVRTSSNTTCWYTTPVHTTSTHCWLSIYHRNRHVIDRQ